METVTTYVHGTERLRNTTNGNPRYKLITTDGTFTAPSIRRSRTWDICTAVTPC
jgi:hypothetical protein